MEYNSNNQGIIQEHNMGIGSHVIIKTLLLGDLCVCVCVCVCVFVCVCVHACIHVQGGRLLKDPTVSPPSNLLYITSRFAYIKL